MMHRCSALASAALTAVDIHVCAWTGVRLCRTHDRGDEAQRCGMRQEAPSNVTYQGPLSLVRFTYD